VSHVGVGERPGLWTWCGSHTTIAALFSLGSDTAEPRLNQAGRTDRSPTGSEIHMTFAVSGSTSLSEPHPEARPRLLGEEAADLRVPTRPALHPLGAAAASRCAVRTFLKGRTTSGTGR
jgi:hypothetical protein